MDSECFSVGDSVRIRDWDDMFSEYGGVPDGIINCKYTFTAAMRKFCGQECEIMHKRGSNIDLRFLDPRINSMKFMFSFSTDMIEPVCYHTFDSEALDSFLSEM